MAKKPEPSGIKLPMPVWDLPVRLFHWLLLALVLTSWISAEKGELGIHFTSGYCILALLLFRVAWGFVGSDTARFSHFLKSPLAALRHLAHFFRREPDTVVGHNEAGGWMVLGLLLLLAVQIATGLSANDDNATEGPLAARLGKEMSDWLTHWHHLTFKIIMLAVIAHVAAVFGYAIFKRHDLVRPMITGRKKLPAATPAPRMVNPIAALVLLAIAGAIAYAVSRL